MTRISERQTGFTLVESMVALVIAGLLLPALLIAFGNQADGVGYIRDKSIAQWVASNQMAQTRIEVAKTGLVFRGEREGVSTMTGRDWYWWINSSATDVDDFRRLTVSVALEPSHRDQPLHTLTGFVSGPAPDNNDG